MRICITACVLFFIIWALSGVYLSSMDDSLLTTLYSGTLSFGPITTTPGYSISYPNAVYADLMTCLFRHWPGWSWHSLALIALNAVSLILIISFLSSRVDGPIFWGRPVLKILFIVAVCAVFFLEPVVLMTYTSTAILLCSASLLYIYHTIAARRFSWTALTALMVLFCISLCLRFQAALFTTSVLFILGFIVGGRSVFRRRTLYSLALTGFCTVALYLFHLGSMDADQKNIEAFDRYYFNLYEANTVRPGYQNPQDPDLKMKLECLQYWFFADPKVFTTALLSEITYDSPFTMANIANWRAKLMRAVRSSFESKDYLGFTDWGIQAIIGLFLNLLLFTVVLLLPVSRTDRVRLSLFNTAFWVIILAVCIVVWMRHRVFVPLVGLYSLLHLVLISDMTRRYTGYRRDMITGFIVTVFLITAAGKIFCIEKSALQKKDELIAKRAFIHELNGMSGRTFVFDTYTLCLLCNEPFRTAILNPRNQLVTTGDYYLRFFWAFRSYWLNKCGSSDYPAIINYLQQHSDSVVFISSSKQMTMTTAYLHRFYDLPFSYNILPGHPAVRSIAHSFMPEHIALDYYIVGK